MFKIFMAVMLLVSVAMSSFAASVDIVWLDKVTSRKNELTLRENQIVIQDGFEIQLQACAEVERMAWLDIVDLNDSRLLYSGWMSADFPGSTAWEHPEYLLLLKGCKS